MGQLESRGCHIRYRRRGSWLRAFKEGREKNMGTFGEPRGMYSAGLGWIGSTLVGGVW